MIVDYCFTGTFRTHLSKGNAVKLVFELTSVQSVLQYFLKAGRLLLQYCSLSQNNVITPKHVHGQTDVFAN